MPHASRTRILILLALAFLLLPTAPARAHEEDDAIRVGLFPLRPIIYRDDAGQAAGMYVDLLNRIAERESWRVEYIDGTWAENLERVRHGEIDLMTVIIKTTEREKFLDFNREPVMTIWGQVFAPGEAGVQSILDLAGKRVAVMKEDVNGFNFRTNAEQFGVDCEIIEADTHAQVFRLVQQGYAAAGVAPNLFGYSLASEYDLVPTSVLFDPHSTGFAVIDGHHAEILDAIDRHLSTWKQDQGSFYYQTLSHWFGQDAGGAFLPAWLLWCAAGAALLALLLLFWNRALQAQVEARTREVRAKESKVRAIFDQTFQFLGVLDTEGRLQEVNRAAVDFLGAGVDDFLGWRFWECPWWNHDPAVQEEVREGIESAVRGHVHVGETTHLDPDGGAHTIRYTLRPVRDENGEIGMIIAEGHDITEQLRLEDELRQSQRLEAIGTLAGGIAHDFNNILSAIVGFNDLARQDAEDRPEIVNSLDEVALAADRAKNLVQQILTFGRRKSAAKMTFRPADVVREAVQLLRSTLPSTIEVEPVIDSGRHILADPTQVHQVVMNLGTNAFHAMEETGGRLTITLRDGNPADEENAHGKGLPEGRCVILTVGDTGPGMDRAMLDKIFEPYFTSKEPGKGTGLGLSVVHGIAKSVGGVVRVQSEPGEGTVFEVILPASESGKDLSAEADEPVHLQGEERILFVDDEPALVALAERFFSALGYRVRSFTDSRKAWACFRVNPDEFDAVITDQTMPRMTGLELASHIRDERPDIPVLLCTGYNAGANPDSADRAGVSQVLYKPILMRSLAEELRSTLGPRGVPAD